MESNFSSFERKVRNKLRSPDWARNYLASGLPKDLDLDGSLNVEIFKKYFLVERNDPALNETIKKLFEDPEHNMLCIESGRGSGKSTFVQTLHMNDPDHKYEYRCIDFSRKDDVNKFSSSERTQKETYEHCEKEVYNLFRKKRSQSLRNKTWFRRYEKAYSDLIKNFTKENYRQSTGEVADILQKIYNSDADMEFQDLFPGNVSRLKQMNINDLRILLLMYLLICSTEPNPQKRYIIVFDSIEVYFSHSAQTWAEAIGSVFDFIRAAFEAMNLETQFYTRFTVIFPIRTATSVSFKKYFNQTQYQTLDIFGQGNRNIIVLERMDFASRALLKKLKYLKDIGGCNTPLYKRCFSICALFMPRQYVVSWLENAETEQNPEFRFFTKSRLMPFFNFDFRKIVNGLCRLLQRSEEFENTFKAMEMIQSCAKRPNFTSDIIANGENMITTRLIFDSLHDWIPNLFEQIGYKDITTSHEPSISRTLFNFLYYSEMKYRYKCYQHNDWGGEYIGVTISELLNKLKPFAQNRLSDISRTLYIASTASGWEPDYYKVNDVWGNFLVITDIDDRLTYPQFHTIVSNYYDNTHETQTPNITSNNLLNCYVRLSDLGRCFTVWASKHYEFLLARARSQYPTEALFVYSTISDTSISEMLSPAFKEVRRIIQNVTIERLVSDCLTDCEFCHVNNPEDRTVSCAFCKNNDDLALFDCSLFQRYQECLVLIVDSLDYLDRFRVFTWQLFSANGNQNLAVYTNDWLLDEISQFNKLFEELRKQVENSLKAEAAEAFFQKMIRLSEDCKTRFQEASKKSEKNQQYYEVLRLPRKILCYHVDDLIFNDAVIALKKSPNSRIFNKIEELVKNPGKRPSIVESGSIDNEERATRDAETIKRDIENCIKDGINRDLAYWAVDSELYFRAVGNSDPRYESLIKALSPEEDSRIEGTFNLLEIIWNRHPELGLAPDYSLLVDKEYNGEYHEKYRDHSTHMFKVFLLGLYLYEKIEPLRNSIEKHFQSKQNSQSAFLSVWTLTALYHDVGYLIETKDGSRDSAEAKFVYERINKILALPLTHLFKGSFGAGIEAGMQIKCFPDRKMIPDRILNLTTIEEELPLLKDAGNAVGLSNDSKKNCIEEYYNYLSVKRAKRSYYDHGVISACILLYCRDALIRYLEDCKSVNMEPEKAKLVTDFLEEVNDFRVYTSEAASAIALHNIKTDFDEDEATELFNKGCAIGNFCIPLNEQPIAYLLRLCDELQCWDRKYYINPMNAPKAIHGDDLRFQIVDNQISMRINSAEIRNKITDALKDICNPPISNLLQIE